MGEAQPSPGFETQFRGGSDTASYKQAVGTALSSVLEDATTMYGVWGLDTTLPPILAPYPSTSTPQPQVFAAQRKFLHMYMAAVVS